MWKCAGGLVAAGLLVTGCKGKGDWRASRDTYCLDVTSQTSYVKLAFTLVDMLESAGSGEAPYLCTNAVAAVSELRGLVDGLATAESALRSGAPDTTEDRAIFATSSDAGEALIHLAVVESPALLQACQSNDRATITGWLDRAHKARAVLEARFAQQTKDCVAAGAK